MTSRSYDEQISSIDAQIERLRARRRDEVVRRERSERRAEAAARMAYGRAVIAWAGGDWRAIDPMAFDAFIRRRSDGADEVRLPSPAPTAEALRAVRALERHAAEGEARQDDERTEEERRVEA